MNLKTAILAVILPITALAADPAPVAKSPAPEVKIVAPPGVIDPRGCYAPAAYNFFAVEQQLKTSMGKRRDKIAKRILNPTKEERELMYGLYVGGYLRGCYHEAQNAEALKALGDDGKAAGIKQGEPAK